MKPNASHPRLWSGPTLLLMSVAFISLCTGRYSLSVVKVSAILSSSLLPLEWANALSSWSATEQKVVQFIRLPRVLIAAISGSGLAVAGAALQGIFRNPLVGPQILGVSSGAAFGGALAILLFSSMPLTVGCAFAGGVLAIMLVYALGQLGGTTSILMLILAGVVISAFFSALISLAIYFADPNNTLPAIVFWLMGSFSTASYAKLWIVLPPAVFGCGLIHTLRFRINALSLGDETAGALGIAVEPMRWIILLCVTLITGATVAVAGTIGWVGLVVPHIARMLVGPDHRVLIPTTMFIGAIYMIAIDTLARSMTSAEIPLGIVTAIIGAPVFAWLLKRTRNVGETA